MPRRLARLSGILLDPAHWATTKNFENGRIWEDIQQEILPVRAAPSLQKFNLKIQYLEIQ